MLVSPKIEKFLMAGSSVFFYSLFIYLFFYWRDIANQGFAITLMKVRKYIIKVKYFASLLFRLINVNISVNEQPEWFHRAHFRWPFYTHCTSRTSFRSWSFYRYRKRFGDLDQWPCQVEKNIGKAWLHFISEFWKWLFTITKISISLS